MPESKRNDDYEKLYDYVTEDEYKKLQAERGSEFVVGGSDYEDDGREIYDDDEDQQLVAARHNQLWTMLRRHLQNTMKTKASIDSTVAYVQYCIHMFPTILELNKEVFSMFV